MYLVLQYRWEDEKITAKSLRMENKFSFLNTASSYEHGKTEVFIWTLHMCSNLFRKSLEYFWMKLPILHVMKGNCNAIDDRFTWEIQCKALINE